MLHPSHELETDAVDPYCIWCYLTPSRDPEKIERPCEMLLNPTRYEGEEKPKMFDHKFGKCWKCSEGFCNTVSNPKSDCTCCGTHPTPLDGVIQGIVRQGGKK